MRLKFSDTFAMGTPIQDIAIPDALLQRQVTGIEWIDEGLGGEGFTPSMVTMFTGSPGAGKTTALLSIADGLTKNGAVCLFNSAEESLFQVKRTVDRLGLRTRFLVGGETNVDEIIKGADKIRNLPANKGKPFFLMVDSLQCLDDGHFATGRITCLTAERSLEKLTTWAKENFTNVIVVGQVTKSGDFAGSNKMKHMVDCHLSLTWERKDKDLLGHRKFKVEKNRFGGTGRTSWLSMSNAGFHVTAIEEA
jgi:DNA repair protein RadA/Sms